MALSYTPTTELDAVNTILKGIGEQPVNNLTTSGISEASLARDKLREISRAIQSKGLHCNSEEEFPLTPDSLGFVTVPGNTLSVDPSDITKDYVRRGDKLYDRENHTFTINELVLVDIVFFLPFEDLPEHVRRYITISAARIFQAETVGSTTLYNMSEKDEVEAKIEFGRKEMRNRDKTMFDNAEMAWKRRRRF